MSTSLKPKTINLSELQEQQIEADGDFSASQETKVKGNKDSSYELADHASHRIHLKLSRKVNDPVKKEYTEESHVVELAPLEYERMVKNQSFAGYDAQTILHDPRASAEQKASKTGDAPAPTPASASKPLVSLQDAHMRYRELTKQDAPADKSFEELLEIIAPLEAKLKAEPSTGGIAPAKPLRTKADYQARYKELTQEDAPEDKTIEQLKEAIAHFEKDNPTA